MCSIHSRSGRAAVAPILGVLVAVVAVACVTYESRVYLQPKRGSGYKVRTFGTGIPDTVVLPLADNSTLQVVGKPVFGGVLFDVAVALDRGHRVRFAEPTIRITCHDTGTQEVPMPEIQEGRIESGRGFFVKRDPREELLGRTTELDLDAPGNFSYGTYSFSIEGTSCGAAPYVLALPKLYVDGVALVPPQFTFLAARARKLDVVSPMN